ncbi:MAG: HEAT repeat domain-containing protein [Acidobacteriota bacterium]
MRFLRLFLPGLLCLASMSLLIGRSQEPEIETTVTPEKSSYLPGEPVFVDVTLTNRTDRPLAEQRFNLLLTNWACSDLIFESASPFVRNTHEGGCGWAGSCLSGAYGPDRTVEPGGSRTKTVLLNQWLSFNQIGRFLVHVYSQPSVKPPIDTSFEVVVEPAQTGEFPDIYERLAEELETRSRLQSSQGWDEQRLQQLRIALSEMPQPFLEEAYLRWTTERDLLDVGVQGCAGLCTPRCENRLAQLITGPLVTEVKEPALMHALRGLGACGDRSYLSLLRSVSGELDEFLQPVAIEAYGRLGGDAAILWLKQLASSDDFRIRRLAIQGLFHTETRAAVSVLIGMLTDPEPSIRESAGNALRLLTRRIVKDSAEKDFQTVAGEWATWWEEFGQAAPVYDQRDCTGHFEEIP